MNKRIILVFFFTIVLFFLSSCDNLSDVNDYLPEPLLQGAKGYETSLVECDIVTEHLTEQSYENRISFKYPQLNYGSTELCEVNELIKNFVNEILDNLCAGSFDVTVNENHEKWQWDNDAYTVIAIVSDYEIMFKDDKFLSIVFEGFLNAKSAAHPTSFIYTLNIDLQTGKPIKLFDIYDINHEFIELYRIGVENSSYEQEIKEYLNKYDDDELISFFSNSESLYNGVWSYFTDNELRISFAVPHAIGDYVVIGVAEMEKLPFFRESELATTSETIETETEDFKQDVLYFFSEINEALGPGPFSVNSLSDNYKFVQAFGVGYNHNYNAIVAEYDGVCFYLVNNWGGDLSFEKGVIISETVPLSDEDKDVFIKPYLTIVTGDEITLPRNIKMGDSRQRITNLYDGDTGYLGWGHNEIYRLEYWYRPEIIEVYTDNERFNFESQIGSVSYYFENDALIKVEIRWFSGYLAFG